MAKTCKCRTFVSEMISYLIIFLLLVILETVYVRVARRKGIVDIPNDRSSHLFPIVRGGGIVFFFAVLTWWIWTGFYAWQLMCGIALLAAVSFADDLREVSVKARLVAQFVATAMILWQIGVPGNPFVWIIGLIVGVGLINSFNFMDGINGLAGLYSLVVLASLFLINRMIVPGYVDERFLVVSAIACVIFCFFNFRVHAVCFAGDVGSIVIGAIVLYALGKLIFVSGEIGWIVLVAVYGVDTGLTLLRRLMKRQNVFESHRMHAYQLASNELAVPQLVVSALLSALQAFIALPAIILGNAPVWYLLVMVIVLAAAYRAVVSKVG